MHFTQSTSSKPKSSQLRIYIYICIHTKETPSPSLQQLKLIHLLQTLCIHLLRTDRPGQSIGLRSQRRARGKGGSKREPWRTARVMILFAASVAWIPSQLT